MDLDLNHIMSVAKDAAQLGREVLLKYFGDLRRVQYKDQAGLVSEADLESEKVILKKIKENFPTHQFLAEEDNYKSGRPIRVPDQDAPPLWVIDPLDGTTNYVHGFSIFCISIGLWYRGRVHLGLIDVPLLNTTYHCLRGEGAFRDKQPLKVSERKNLDESLLATGFFTGNSEALKDQLDIFTRLVPKTRGIRRAGAAAYDLCMVAEGVFDAFWEKNLSPWDTAAGSLLVEEAGGRTSTYEGGEYNIFSPSILASNDRLHTIIQEEISRS